MSEKPKIYLDACCFIDLAKQGIRQLGNDRKADVWYSHQILVASKAGDVIAYTSTLSISECIHAAGLTDENVRNIFIRLLDSGQYVTLIQHTPFIGHESRKLLWTHGIKLRGIDYAHVASGTFMKCNEFLTTDERIHNAGPRLGQHYSMRVVLPRDTRALPGKYRQQSFDEAILK